MSFFIFQSFTIFFCNFVFFSYARLSRQGLFFWIQDWILFVKLSRQYHVLLIAAFDCSRSIVSIISGEILRCVKISMRIFLFLAPNQIVRPIYLRKSSLILVFMFVFPIFVLYFAYCLFRSFMMLNCVFCSFSLGNFDLKIGFYVSSAHLGSVHFSHDKCLSGLSLFVFTRKRFAFNWQKWCFFYFLLYNSYYTLYAICLRRMMDAVVVLRCNLIAFY